MPVEVTCPSCGHAMTIPDEYTGKRGKCGKCQTPLVVPVAGVLTPELRELVECLSDGDWEVRVEALEALAQKGGDAASTASEVALSLEDPVPAVRAGAARALGRIQGDRESTETALRASLRDSRPAVREAASRSLGIVPEKPPLLPHIIGWIGGLFVAVWTVLTFGPTMNIAAVIAGRR